MAAAPLPRVLTRTLVTILGRPLKPWTYLDKYLDISRWINLYKSFQDQDILSLVYESKHEIPCLLVVSAYYTSISCQPSTVFVRNATIHDTILRILSELLLVSHTVEPVRSASRSHTIW